MGAACKLMALAGAAWAAFSASSAVVIVSPADGTTVPLVNGLQKGVAATASSAARERFLSEYKTGRVGLLIDDGLEVVDKDGDRIWRRPLPVTFTWRATAGEEGPWKLAVATKADFSDARTMTVRQSAADIVRFVWTNANLQAGVTYRWRVSAAGGERAESAFLTDDAVPRWIVLEGRIANVRDLGGYVTEDGRHVRQGLVYRGQGLNDNSRDGGITPGVSRLKDGDRELLTNYLGIRTDLDLRSIKETAGSRVSPMGEKVNLFTVNTLSYADIFSGRGKKAMAKGFRVFCRRENYPIYFHCIAGASRTGSLAYVLNGLLGVPKRKVEIDWEFTYYPDVPQGENERRGLRHFDVGFATYGKPDDSLSKRIELYLLDCGVTADEIAAFRNIMLN